MKDVIELIAKSLVEKSEAVKIDAIEEADERGPKVTLKITCDQGDYGRIIGKQGNTAEAIRTILKNCNSRDGKRYFIQIGDEARAPRRDDGFRGNRGGSGYNDASY